MSSLTGKEIQIVTALSRADLSESVIGSSCVKELIGAVVDAQNQTQSANDALQRARNEKSSQNVLSNWWNNTEDKIKDAQLSLTTEISNLNRHSSQLLIFNTAVSKVLCDQQDVLLGQQRRLEEQARQLALQNATILDQQEQLAVQQQDIRTANQGLLEAKGLTATQARDLIGCVRRVEAAEERIVQVNQHVQEAIAEQLEQARKDVAESLSAAVDSLEARDQKLMRIAQDQQQKLIRHSEGIEGKLNALNEALPGQIEQSVGLHLAPGLEKIGALELRLEQQAAEHKRLAKRSLIISVLFGLALLAVAWRAVVS